MSTLSRADVFGTASQAGALGQGGGVGNTQVTGPNPSSVTASAQGGSIPMVSSNGQAAFSWVGFVVALILLRVALEAGGESR